jgi:hypothetical protein
MFGEAAVSNWLTNGRHPNGMIIRLQGFDKGVFGGNYHTHNTLQIPPGVDVVCYSNGEDYARGWRFVKPMPLPLACSPQDAFAHLVIHPTQRAVRLLRRYAVEQASAGRVVMSVDSTNLLNLRHLHGGDDKWRRPYPDKGEMLPWSSVVRYGGGGRRAIVTYGNGVVAALQAREELPNPQDVVVIDSPYLSSASSGLRAALREVDEVVFADVCKQGQHPLAGIITELHADGDLPARWGSVAALATYNPLGSTMTFTSSEDIVQACASTFTTDEVASTKTRATGRPQTPDLIEREVSSVTL